MIVFTSNNRGIPITMARTGISFEDVRDAAESLLGRGLNPTIQRVRERLGTGSNTTISEHLKSWQCQLNETPKSVLPPTVPETVMTALDAFWKIAVQNAEAAFEEQRIAAAQAILEAEQSRDTAIAERQQAQSDATELRRQLEAAQIAARELADRLLVEQERRAAAETAIQSAEQRAQNAAETVAQIRAETDARVAQLEIALQRSRADMTQHLAEARQQIEAERQRGAVNETKLTEMLDHARAEHLAERQTFAGERQNWQSRDMALARELEQRQREQAELQSQLSGTREELRQMTVELEATRTTSQEQAAHHLATARTLEISGVRLEAESQLRQQLERELENLHALLKHRLASTAGDEAETTPPPPKTGRKR